jgi:AcrR family transcriptional regulator
MTETEPTSRRERIRQLTQDEIKSIAMRQVAEGGVQHISMNAIAKEMGMSGPALYRYFQNKQALLMDVVSDGFCSMHEAIVTADETAGSVEDRILAMGRAYRRWAKENSEVYGLLLSTTIPGEEDRSLELCMASRDAVMPLILAVAEYAQLEFTPVPAEEIDVENPYGDIPERFRYVMIRMWSRLHGLVMLEIHGHMDQSGIDPDGIFELELEDTLGLVKRATELLKAH